MPEIELWNIDEESCEPAAVLGGKSNGKIVESYDDGAGKAVLSLSLNPIQTEYLASASEDHSISIWDLDDLECKATLNVHKDKVQTVRWNPKNDNCLLSGGFDRVLNVLDVRDDKSAVRTKIPKSAGDLESASWHSIYEHNFAVSTESGKIFGYDTRKLDSPLFEAHAHESACSQVVFSPHISSMMVTCGNDGYVKVWDIGKGDALQVASKDVKQGELFSL